MYKYVHGGDIYSARELSGKQDILDFSVNTNPLGLTEDVKQALIAHIDDCDKYPDPFCRDLVSALAAYEQVDPAFIVCGNGASDLIFRLPLALKPQKALICAPTFADYEKALKTVNCSVQHYLLTAEHDFQVQSDFVARINDDIDVIYLCNPNNPTGQLCSPALIRDILEKSRLTGTIVLLDECFMDFIDDADHYSAKRLLQTYPNLVILKAFTKIFAMAGLRLGYILTANERLIAQMRLHGQDWTVSNLAQAAGIAALSARGYLEQTRNVIAEERHFLRTEISRLGFKMYGSYANYIFFRTDGIADLAQKLLAKGMMIRACANYRGLDDCYYRIAVKTHADNIRLIDALREVIAP